MNTERRHDIDWLRVIAIGILLIYHIAIIFQPWAMFIGFIRNNDSLEPLWKIMSMINVWRIPLLFYVSGMGVYFAMQKRQWKALLLDRTKRILLPFLFGIIAITPLHMYIFQSYYNLPLNYHLHWGHLWFLGNIFVYVILLTPLFFYLKTKEDNLFKTMLSKLVSSPLGLLSLSILFILETVLINPQLFELYANTWHGFLLGFLAFLFGFLLMYSGTLFWKTVLKWKWLYLGLALTLSITRVFILESLPNYFMALESYVWILSIFGLGHQFLNKPSTILNYLKPAVYPIYIIHMAGLYLGALLILPLDLHPSTKFISITLFTGLFCLLTYEFIIKRIQIIRPLFGLN